MHKKTSSTIGGSASTFETIFDDAERYTAKGASIIQKDGKTYVCGKLYKPGYKLPEGIVIKGDSIKIEGKADIRTILKELAKLSEEWE